MMKKLIRIPLFRFIFSGLLITAVSVGITLIILHQGGTRAFGVSIGYTLSSLLGYYLHSLVSFRNSLQGRLAPFSGYLVLLTISALSGFLFSTFAGHIFSTDTMALIASIVFPVGVNYVLWQSLVSFSRLHRSQAR